MRTYQRIIVGSTASVMAASLALTLAGCGKTSAAATISDASPAPSEAATTTLTGIVNTASTVTSDTSGLFTERDLTQVADTTNAAQLVVQSGEDIQITQEGVYVISGEATGVTIYVNVDDSSKVQLVLDGVSITNEDFPVIYVQNADKVFVTTVEGTTNTLQVTSTFVADGDTNTDAVIFSKDDLVLNGLGTLVVNSTNNGVTSKDDLKVTGGTYVIQSAADAFEANDSIAVADGTFAITTSKDGFHAENDEDDSQGSIYLEGGTYTIEAGSDGIQATTTLQIDGGSYRISGGEALEATYIQINDGDLDIYATDDGINASSKSASVGTPAVEINGGKLTIEMAQGDTDAIDVNGNLTINGGELDITAQFAFDFDGTATYNGGTIYVNGEQVSEITNSMMGGMGGRGMGGMGFGEGEMGGPGMGHGDRSGMGANYSG